MGRPHSPEHTALGRGDRASATEGGIRSHQVARSFGRKAVLSGASFWAPPGEITLLAGRNGAGKTTWVRIAAGLARADRGSVSFAGAAVTNVRPSLAVVSDEPPVYGRFDGHANLRLLSGRRRPPAARLREVRDVLALDDSLLRRRTRGYSLGQRRRLAIAGALLREPRFLFLDEPTIGLDPIAWAAVREALRDSARRETAVLLTGQDFGELEAVCGRVAVLAGGVIAFEGEKAALTRRRPPRVRVVTEQADALRQRVGRPCLKVGPSTLEFLCRDLHDARRTLDGIRAPSTRFTELGIVQDTLEQALVALYDELDGERHEQSA